MQSRIQALEGVGGFRDELQLEQAGLCYVPGVCGERSRDLREMLHLQRGCDLVQRMCGIGLALGEGAGNPRLNCDKSQGLSIFPIAFSRWQAAGKVAQASSLSSTAEGR